MQRKELNDRINRKHISINNARGKSIDRKVLYQIKIILYKIKTVYVYKIILSEGLEEFIEISVLIYYNNFS